MISSIVLLKCALIVDRLQAMFFYILLRINIFYEDLLEYFFCHGTVDDACVCKIR